jgi:PAS domain S-box-containing protein
MRTMGTSGDGAVRRDRTSDLQLLVDSAPSLIHTGRPDGYLDFFNQTWLRYVGCSLEDLQDWKWTAFIHPEDVEGIVEKWRASLASGEPFLHEARVLRADGQYRWMLHHKVAARDGCGQIVKWYGSSIDIEDRKRAELQLRRSTQELQRSEFYLAEGQRLAHIGSWAFDLAGFDYWSPELFRMHGLDPARKPPTVQEYLDCIHPQDRESMANLIQGLSAKALPFDATTRIVRPKGKVRYIRCVGAPVVENESLKKYVGSAIDVTEHELATQELRRREAYLADAQRLSHTGSFGWRPDDGEVVWSDETYRIFEYDNTRRPTIDSVVQRIHPQDRALVQQVIDRASQTGADFEHAYRLLLLDGRVKHVHAIAHAVQNASGDREFIGAVTDITERKTADDKIRRLVEAGIFGIFFANVDGAIVEANQAFLQMLQYDRQDLVSGRLRWADLTPAEWRERDERALTEFLETGVFHYEKEYFRKDGSRVPVLVGGARLQNPNEGVVFVLDLSEQKRAEEKIREQEMEFRQMLDLSPQQVVVFGPGGERLYANRIALDYVGLSLEEWRQISGNVFRPGWFIHPEDQEGVAGAYSDSNRSSGSAYELELRVRGADGNYRWFLVRYNPLHDDKGQVKRWYVVSTDIEDRKRAEQKLQQENVALREEIDKASMFEEIVGTSRPLKAVLSRIAKVGPTDSTVLITGETGTGKELIARAVHKRSQRSGRPFVSVNCAALPPTLVSSELFGHEKGAFTGATERRLGRFEMADGGTIFLDEVGELLPDTQAALLRVLQEREFERVGGGKPIRVDVRVIAASNRDLNAANGTFRQDLLYRLNVFPIEMPPLRERKDDILILVEYFVQRYANRAGKNIRSIDQKTLDLLQSYDWPGNIRELQNVIERSIILSTTDVFSVDELWLSKRTSPHTSRAETSPALRAADLQKNVEPRSEREIIEAALAETRGRVSGPSGAAAKLRIPPSTLETRIKALKINKQQFKFG